MALEYSKPDINKQLSKPVAPPNKGFPYSSLDDRRFEELLYSICLQRIKNGDWQDRYDDINILQGVRERGRDCTLHLGGMSRGVIQCKHSVNETQRISKPECAREIIKFVLHAIVDDQLISDPKDFTYYFAVSHGFSEPAISLLTSFSSIIGKETDLKDWTSQVIKENIALRELKYDGIELRLKEILESIKVEKILSQDLDRFLNEDGFQPVVKAFFEVRTVVETKVVDELKDEIKRERDHKIVSPMPVEYILKKFQNSSHHLLDYQDFFDGIEDSHISRKETKELLDWVLSPIPENEEPVALLVGNAGLGKTVIFKDLLSELLNSGIATIGLKADRYYAESINALEEKLHLEDSLQRMVRALSSQGNKVVVLIDQIDALSQSLSAKRNFIDTYNLLVRELLSIPGVRILISVRTYDLQYDTDLRFYEKQRTFEVGYLTEEQVFTVLSKLHIEKNQVPKPLLELLRTPQHLNVFCRVYDNRTNLNSIKSLQDLYNNLWVQKVSKVPSTSAVTQHKVEKLVYEIAKRMHEQQRISIPAASFTADSRDELEYLKSNTILSESERQIQFFHQTFFDFAFAKQFVESGSSIKRYLKENHQGLFIRSSLRMILEFIREDNHRLYIQSIQNILLSTKYRFHIKLMIVNTLGYQESPTAEEKSFVRLKIQSSYLWRPFLESIRSKEWLVYLVKQGDLYKQLNPSRYWYDRGFIESIGWIQTLLKNIQIFGAIQSYSSRLVLSRNLTFQILSRHLPRCRKEVCQFLLNSEEFEGKGHFVFRLLYFVKVWDVEDAYMLFEKYRAAANQDQFGYYQILETAFLYNPQWVFKQYKTTFIGKLRSVESPFDRPQISYDDEELIKKMFLHEGRKAFEYFLPMVTELGASRFLFFDYSDSPSSHYTGDDLLYYLLIEQVKIRAKKNPEWFKKFYKDHNISNSVLHEFLLVYGLMSNPEYFLQEVFEFLQKFMSDEKLEHALGKFQCLVRSLLGETYGFLSMQMKNVIDSILLNILPSFETEMYFDGTRKRHKLSRLGHCKMLYLKSLPEQEILARPLLKRVFQELERKFDQVKDKDPNRMVTTWVGNPMDRRAYEKMGHDDWIVSFEKYNCNYQAGFGTGKGSILEHARAFEMEVEKRPEYFAPLIEGLVDKPEIEHQYITAGLSGLKKGNFDVLEVQRIFKKAIKLDMDRNHTLYLIWCTSYFIEKKVIDQEVLEYLIENALDHSDPEGIKGHDDVLMDGANNVRGAAAQRITEINFNPHFRDLIFDALNRIADDRHISVRVSVVVRLAYLMRLDKDKALDLFLYSVKGGEPDILQHSVWSAQYFANSSFSSLTDYFKKTIEIKEAHEQISTLLAVAWINGENDALVLLEKLFRTSDTAKVQAIQVAVRNFGEGVGNISNRCKELYFRFLSSNCDDVARVYNIEFLHISPVQFESIYSLLKAYSTSVVCRKQPNYFLEYLLQCVKKYPLKCLELISNVTSYDKPDISKSGYYEDEPVKIIVGAYNSLNALNPKPQKELTNCIKFFDKVLKDTRFRMAADKVMFEVDQ